MLESLGTVLYAALAAAVGILAIAVRRRHQDHVLGADRTTAPINPSHPRLYRRAASARCHLIKEKPQ